MVGPQGTDDAHAATPVQSQDRRHARAHGNRSRRAAFPSSSIRRASSRPGTTSMRAAASSASDSTSSSRSPSPGRTRRTGSRSRPSSAGLSSTSSPPTAPRPRRSRAASVCSSHAARVRSQSRSDASSSSSLPTERRRSRSWPASGTLTSPRSCAPAWPDDLPAERAGRRVPPFGRLRPLCAATR